MGLCGSKESQYPDVDEPKTAQDGAVAQASARASARASAAKIPRSPRASKHSGRLSTASTKKAKAEAAEEASRSAVGRLMQENDGRCRRFSDEYDDSSAHVLGSGMSGSVFTAISRRTGLRHAIKTLNIEQMGVDGMAELRREISAMRRLDHPNIVRIFETYEDQEGGQIIMVLELCSGGELVNKLMAQPQNQGLSEHVAAKLLTKMLSALRHCHEHDVVHRDIKLDNFVYESAEEDAELKLIDFGLSHVAAAGRGSVEAMKGRVGTLSYMAPEVLKRLPYTAACDMWSLGVVAFILLSGRRPFHSRERQEKIDRILHTEPNYNSSSWATVSDTAKDFVMQLLVKEPTQRMGSADAMAHAFITSNKAASTGKELANPAAAIAHHAHVLRSMQAFSGASMMHKVALELLAFATPSAQLDDTRQIFYALDTDGSGTISREEFDAAMAAHPELNSAALKTLFETLDFAKKGELGYNEFLAATLGGAQQLSSLDEPTVRNVFQMLDRDSDGIVTRDDLLQCLGVTTSEEELDCMFEQMGKAHDGKLFFMDLFRLMTGRDGTKQAGITLKVTGSSSGPSAADKRASAPSLASLGRSSTMSNVTLHSEAVSHNADPLAKAGRSVWASKGRSVQNLNRFLAASTAARLSKSAGAHDGAEGETSEPKTPVRPRKSSADGTTMVLTAAAPASALLPMPSAAPGTGGAAAPAAADKI